MKLFFFLNFCFSLVVTCGDVVSESENAFALRSHIGKGPNVPISGKKGKNHYQKRKSEQEIHISEKSFPLSLFLSRSLSFVVLYESSSTKKTKSFFSSFYCSTIPQRKKGVFLLPICLGHKSSRLCGLQSVSVVVIATPRRRQALGRLDSVRVALPRS